MKLEFHWCVPVGGDGFHLGLPTWERPPTLDYAVAIAKTAEARGFTQLLFGMGFDNHPLEAWTLATAVLALTDRIAAMIAVRPGFFSAPVLAKMVVTLDHISQGRLSLNIVTGGRPDEQAMYGDYLDHDARYRRTREFLEICRRLWSSPIAFDYDAEFHTLKQTRLELPPTQRGGPAFYFGGASEAATQVCAAWADVYLMWGEPLAQIRERIEGMRPIVEAERRTTEVRYGLRINVIARPTTEEARAAAREMLSKVPALALERGRRTEFPNTRRQSIGQGRQWEFRGQADEDWYLGPGFWAGIAVVRSGAGMALVGSYEEVAAMLLEYVALGIGCFILSGYPHLEECENVGRRVLPLVREGHLRSLRKPL